MAQHLCRRMKKVRFALAQLFHLSHYRADLGLKATIETIDNRGDFKTYMQNYVYARGGNTAPKRRAANSEDLVRELPIPVIISSFMRQTGILGQRIRRAKLRCTKCRPERNTWSPGQGTTDFWCRPRSPNDEG